MQKEWNRTLLWLLLLQKGPLELRFWRTRLLVSNEELG